MYDYYSKLVDMNKPMDTTKTIHSNNYLSVFIKKENIKKGNIKKVNNKKQNALHRSRSSDGGHFLCCFWLETNRSLF